MKKIFKRIKNMCIFNDLNRKDVLKYLIISLIFTIILMNVYFLKGLLKGQDVLFHISRLKGIISAIRDKQLPIAIYPYKNYDFSYASPLFYCDLFLIPFAIINHYLFSFSHTIILMIFIFTFLSLFNMLLITRYLFKQDHISYFITFIYAFSQFHIIDIYQRTAIGEIIAFSIMPFLILGFYHFFVEKNTNSNILYLSFSFLLLSHNISFFIACVYFLILCILYFKELYKNKDLIIYLFKSIFKAILLSSFFLFPLIEQMLSQDFIYKHLLHDSIMMDKALTIFQAIFDQSIIAIFETKELSVFNYRFYGLGLGVVLLFFSLIFIKNKNKEDKFYASLLIISFILFLTTFKLIPFDVLAILKTIQFPWRLNIIILPSLLISSAYFLFTDKTFLKKIIIISSLFFVIINAILLFNYFNNNSDFDIIKNDVTYEDLFSLNNDEYNYNINELINGEYLPNTNNFNYAKAYQNLTFKNGELTPFSYERNGTHFIIHTDYIWDTEILLPITYYKGYKAYEIDEDNKIIKEINIDGDEFKHLVSINIDKGKHTFKVYYAGTIIQKISLFTSITYLLFIIYKNLKDIS